MALKAGATLLHNNVAALREVLSSRLDETRFSCTSQRVKNKVEIQTDELNMLPTDTGFI